ncbi:MAG: hypothetical protein OEX08_03695 [Candidatus Nomurabacteria bacterium]|nr:hypothetical protein [Candidatus Nomurabacteria bacterium]
MCKKKNVLFVSQHGLWKPQRKLLKSIHNLKSRKEDCIKTKSIRFNDFEEFLSFYRKNINDFHIYPVIPLEWKKKMKDLGYSIGVLYKPIKKIDQGNEKYIFKAEYFTQEEIITKTVSVGYGCGGYRNGTGRKRGGSRVAA